MIDALYFATEGELWEWYSHHSAACTEVWLGLYKKASRVPSITIAEAMNMAIRFGWSESKWLTVDAQRFCIRFTPRLPNKKWSALTIKRFLELEALGEIQEAGYKAWENRKE